MKKILVIAPFDTIYPPMNGGMQRCFNIILQLAEYFQLTIIIHQKKDDFLLATNQYPVIKKIKVHSTQEVAKSKDLFNILPQKLQNALRYRWYKKTLKGPADGHFLAYYSILITLLKKEKFDVIILENLSTLNAVSLLKKYDTTVKVIYDAHNVDTHLAESSFKKNQLTGKTVSFIKNKESSVHTLVDALLVCSENDKDGFIKLNKGKLHALTVPNGVTIATQLADEEVLSDTPSHVLFCGTLSSPPNSEGLLWFYNFIWPLVQQSLPHLKLLVLGSGNAPPSLLPLFKDNSVTFTGSVSEVKKYYNQCAISIVPLKTGSGTRLKILEAMSYGLPVIATNKGAEGIAYTKGSDIIIADDESSFAKKIIYLIHNKEQRVLLQQKARQLVMNKYDWNIIGKNLSYFIHNEVLH